MQTFGDLANFNRYLHVLVADGVFGADGTFSALPPVPEALLAGDSRRAVLAFLVKERAITDELCVKMLGWRYCGGFSAHNQVRVGAHDAESRGAGQVRIGEIQPLDQDADECAVEFQPAGLACNEQVIHPGSAESAANRSHRPDVRKRRD